MDRNKPSVEHECVKDESFREMTGEFKGLSKRVEGLCTDVALVKRDVSDLKQVTVTMSDCIRALTDSSIKAGENNITRDQFYGKIDELIKTRQLMIDTLQREITQLRTSTDDEIDKINIKLVSIQLVCDDYTGMKNWIWGILAAIVIMIIVDLYRVLIMHA
jgi:hypothetical protein